MIEELVRIERAEETATLILNRPEKRNALNTPLIRAATDALGELSREAHLRVLVLGGAGEAFSGGADVREMAGLDEAGARAYIAGLHGLIRAVREFPGPVVGRCHGYTLGGGLELLLGCDLRVAADDSLIGMPEVRLGFPSVIHAALLVPAAGLAVAQELLLTGRTISGAEAARRGIVHRAAPRDRLDEAVSELVGELLDSAPGALRAQKALLRDWLRAYVEAAVPTSMEAFVGAYRTGEPQEGISALLGRRKPRWAPPARPG